MQPTSQRSAPEHNATESVQESIRHAVSAHAEAVRDFFDRNGDTVERLAASLADAFANGRKLLVCGNGGSACDAMHIAGEFVGRFMQERKALPAIALSADGGALTAIGNDYGFERVFARQVEALGEEGDMLIALSTSGASPNVLAALEAARSKKLVTVLLTGEKGKTKTGAADTLLAVSSGDTARVQEVHIIALHLLADITERMMFSARR